MLSPKLRANYFLEKLCPVQSNLYDPVPPHPENQQKGQKEFRM